MRGLLVAIVVVAIGGEGCPRLTEAPVGLEDALEEPVERGGEDFGVPEFAREEDGPGDAVREELSRIDLLTVDGGAREDCLLDGVAHRAAPLAGRARGARRVLAVAKVYGNTGFSEHDQQTSPAKLLSSANSRRSKPPSGVARFQLSRYGPSLVIYTLLLFDSVQLLREWPSRMLHPSLQIPPDPEDQIKHDKAQP